jgi:hypothetical protein
MFWDEYPDKEILVCELMDRGCDRDEAEALIQAEHHRREAMVS